MYAEPIGWKKPMSPNQREDNPRARALLATVGSEGSSRGSVEHSESEPKVAYGVGNLAKYGKALKLDNSISLDG